MTHAERAERLDAIAKVEDSLYRARSEFQGPTMRNAVRLHRPLADQLLAAKRAIDLALDTTEALRGQASEANRRPALLPVGDQR